MIARGRIQNERMLHAELRTQLELLYADAESSLEQAEANANYEMQREVLLPTKNGERPYFVIGVLENSQWRPGKVPAARHNDAWLHSEEPCADCGAELVLPELEREQHNTLSHPVAELSRVECGCCGALYNRMMETQFEGIKTRICDECQMPAENSDGGPQMCFRCRDKNGIPTVCAGCGCRYQAESHDPELIAEWETKSRSTQQRLRLCGTCNKPAPPSSKEAHRYYALDLFRNVQKAFGHGAQGIEAVNVAARNGQENLPQCREPFAWSEAETKAATEWLGRQIAGEHTEPDGRVH